MATVGTIMTITDLSGNTYNIHGMLYGQCDTAAAIQAKTVAIPGITNLSTGLSIRVKFTYAQWYNGIPTLNVNNLGAKNIRRTSVSNAAIYEWDSNEILDLVYDGTYWVIVDGGLASTNYYGVTKLATSATNTSMSLALTPASLNSTVANMIASYPIYSTSETYAVGDRVRYSFNLYECNTAITTYEAWTAAHWTKLPTLIDMIESGGGVLPSVTSSDNGKVLQVSNGEWEANNIAIIGNINSAPIASFSDAIPTNAIDVTIGIEPVQDLHGYDNPWPAGGGKNLLNNSSESVTQNGVTFTVNADGIVATSGTANGTAVFRIWQEVSAASDVILSGCPAGGNYETGYSMMCCNDNGSSVISPGGIDIGAGTTIPAESVALIRQTQIIIRSGVNTNGLVFKPMIRLASETDSTFAPYSNICPISGWTGANVTRTGKNLFDLATCVTGYLNSDGLITQTIQGTVSDYILVKSGQYTVSRKQATNWWKVAVYGFDKSFKSMAFNAAALTERQFTITEDSYIRLGLDYVATSADEVQIEKGTFTNYEPYTGTTITISWQSDAGTVYGGTLDVTTGLLTVTMAEVDLGTLTWNIYNGVFYTSQMQEELPNFKANGEVISDRYKYVSSRGFNVNDYEVTTSALILIKDPSYNGSVSAFKTAMSGVQLVYELATPQTYQLTPTEVALLLGNSNVWADTGNIFIKYRRQDSLGINENIATMSEFKSYLGIT